MAVMYVWHMVMEMNYAGMLVVMAVRLKICITLVMLMSMVPVGMHMGMVVLCHFMLM